MTVLDEFRLANRVAAVTGAGKGIGRDIALCLAEAGADVAVAARSEADLNAVVSDIEGLGRRAIAVPTDVTKVAALDALAGRTVAELGKLDIWVSNAGGLPDAIPRYLTRTPEDRWDAQMDLNLKSVWAGAVAAAKHMPEGGVIINISSGAARSGQAKNGPYGASKAAVNHLTATLAIELAPTIRVNAVAPGPIPTQNFVESTGLDPEKDDSFIARLNIPVGRLGTGRDIGAAVVFMASPASSWISGQTLYVTGGS